MKAIVLPSHTHIIMYHFDFSELGSFHFMSMQVQKGYDKRTARKNLLVSIEDEIQQDGPDRSCTKKTTALDEVASMDKCDLISWQVDRVTCKYTLLFSLFCLDHKLRQVVRRWQMLIQKVAEEI